jgi:hypothetical protein
VLTDNATTSFGTIIAIPSATSVVLTKITGTFSTGNIKVGGVVVGTVLGAQVQDGAATALLHAQYRNLAADVYRALIAAIPGSGNILGVWLYNDVVYAFRNDAGGTKAVMYKSTASGWSAVTLGEEISFTNANASVGDGDTLTQGAVTATISASWCRREASLRASIPGASSSRAAAAGTSRRVPRRLRVAGR